MLPGTRRPPLRAWTPAHTSLDGGEPALPESSAPPTGASMKKSLFPREEETCRHAGTDWRLLRPGNRAKDVILIVAISNAFDLRGEAGRDLNKTCCLNGGTCILGSFCACPPSFYGRNCERNTYTQKCGSVPHGTWLPQKCSMCRCWLGQIRCFPQTFLPGCEGHMRDEHPAASGAPRSVPSVGTAFLLATFCLLLGTWV